MAYLRRQRRFGASERVTVRLTTAQRDVLLGARGVSPTLGHLLHRAHVTDGQLAVRLARGELDTLIAAAANVAVADRQAERGMATLLRYLESIEDRFVDAGGDDEAGGAA